MGCWFLTACRVSDHFRLAESGLLSGLDVRQVVVAVAATRHPSSTPRFGASSTPSTGRSARSPPSSASIRRLSPPRSIARACSRAAAGCRATALDPYLPFVRDTLAQYPRLRTTRLHEMSRQRGYPGSAVQVRRAVRHLRPASSREAYLRLATLPGEVAQVDWGRFGHVRIGRSSRPLSAIVLVLGYSRALHAVFSSTKRLRTSVPDCATASSRPSDSRRLRRGRA